MPFTPAHALAAVPLTRGRFLFSALVIGTMVPDFSKIVTLSPAASVGHSWGGIFWFCTPVGLALLWIFHAMLKRPLFVLLPTAHQQRLYPLLHLRPVNRLADLPWNAASVATGAFTHLVWDAFTHHDGLGTTLFPALNTAVVQVGEQALPLYKLLQHGSTVVGVTVLALLYWRWFKKAPVHEFTSTFSEQTKSRLITFLFLGVLIAAAWSGLRKADGSLGLRWLQLFAGSSMVTAMAVLGVEVLLFSVWFHLRGAELSPVRPDRN